MTKGIDIYSALSDSRGLSQLVKQVDEITVVVYVYYDAVWCAVLRDYLTENEKDISCVKRVIVLDIPLKERELRESVIHVTFPNAEIVCYTKAWNEIDPHDIYIDTPLVLHFATSLGNIANDFLNHCEESAPMRRLIEQTRLLYAAVILGTEKIPCVTIYSQLDTFKFADYVDYFARSSYCLSKERYIRQCQKELTPQSALMACLEEAKHGCEECCMVAKYGKTKVCPLAQHEVALMYRDEDNPSAQSLSHQLERLAAYQGYMPSQIQLADNYADGCGCGKDVYAALSIYKRLAYEGNTLCSDKIIALADKEDSVSNLVALPWIIRHANARDLDKASFLAKVFSDGSYGVPIDRTYSEKWQTLLAESGDEKYIADLMRQALQRQDWKDSIKWSRKLRDLDSELFDNEEYINIRLKYILSIAPLPPSQYSKGKSYLTGSTQSKDVELAEACIVLSAEGGYLPAQEFLCEEYYSGRYFTKDFKKSAYWGDMALEQGSREVRFRVAWLYCGEGNVTPDYEKSHKLYKALAKEGNSAAMNNLGWMCENGYFYTVNPKKAFEWYQKAAEAGDEVAMRNLGYCYKDATGVEKDDSLAFTWFCKAASRGDTSAIKQVINCYKNGLGVEKDDQKVVEWYEKLIGAGETSALVDLGHYYETVIVDYEKALLYYRKAAESGNIVGQYNMGIMYQYGKGVEKDETTAIYWYRKSARQGYISAQNRLKEMDIDWLETDE